MTEEYSEEIQGNMLKDPLTIADLLASGKQFEINSDNNNVDGLHYDYFDDYGMNSDEDDTADIDPKILTSPWQEPFDKLRKSMTKVNEFIYKRIVYPGNENSQLVPDKARVSIQYTSYAENSAKTLDSTYLRGRPHVFHTGFDQILPGIEEAVKTMKLEEESHFVISYKLLYGEIGCPPRVPPRADYLFVIKVLRFDEVGDLNAMENISNEDKNKFSIVFPKIKEIHKKGKDFFKMKNYLNAVKAFLCAVNNISICHLSNEAEEKEYIDFLMTLYTNLATTYSIMQEPAKVCSMCNQMRSLSNQLYKQNAKALYREGKAYSDLGEFEKARKLLLEAKYILETKNQPPNEFIVNELKTLNNRKLQYEKQNKEICTRAFGLMKIDDTDKPKTEKNDLFIEDMRETLNEFKINEALKEFQLPDGLSNNEIECIEEIVKDMGMKLTTAGLNKKKMITKIN